MIEPKPRHLADHWEGISLAFPERRAVVQGDRERTWRELDERAGRFAAALRAAGLRAQDSVGICLYNDIEYAEVFVGALKARAIPVNVNYRYRAGEIAHVLQDADARVVIYDAAAHDEVLRAQSQVPGLELCVEVGGNDAERGYEQLLAAHSPAPHERRDPDDVILIYTGGTTGRPKGVAYDVGSLLNQMHAQTAGFLGPDDAAVELVSSGRYAALPACPLMHGAGLFRGLLGPLSVGGTSVLLTSRSLDAAEVWATVQRREVNLLAVVGDAVTGRLVASLESATDHPSFPSLRVVTSTGAALSASLKRRLLDRVPQLRIVETIGATEGLLGRQVMTADDSGLQTGRFTPLPTTRILTEDGRLVPPGTPASGLLVATANLPLGYRREDPSATSAFREIDGKRVSVPGDMGRFLEDGTMEFLGRGSTSINSGGEKVHPEEIEAVIREVDGVEDCLVLGAPSAEFGEEVAAVVAVRQIDPPSVDAILGAVRATIAGYKVPRRVVLVDTVPRNEIGKADLAAAQALVRSGA